MQREDAIREVKRRWREIAPSFMDTAKKKVNGEATYICPRCGNGAGEDGTGIAVNPRSKDGAGLHCFKCGWSGDIIALFQEACNLSFNDSLYALASEIGITIDGYRPSYDMEPEEKEEVREVNYTNYYRACRESIETPEAVSYLTKRGISLETAKAYWIGFDAAADPASAPGGEGEKKHPAPRIIIPTSTKHYVARSIDPATPKQYQKLNPNRDKGAGSPSIFNGKALYSKGMVFITEGVFDALSIIEAGSAAIAINSTSNVEIVLKKLEEKRTEATLVLCLDNDEAGQKAQEGLMEGLKKLNISFLEADICGGFKDPNEFLQADRTGFEKAVKGAGSLSKPDSVSLYIENDFAADIEIYQKCQCKTGFDTLDKLSKGLHPGLYCLAAVSSLGKTTFALQIADQIAEAGTDVLFFSLEQSRFELVSKSIARRVNQGGTRIESGEIREGKVTRAVIDGIRAYQSAVGDRMSIIEGNFNCNVDFVEEYVKRYIAQNNTTPVIFIDYLQILRPAPEAMRNSIRENIDTMVTQLKRLSRSHNVIVFVISSVNRSNYLNQMDFDSLKESGGIEYSCDCVWGLQLACVGEQPELFDGSKSKLNEQRMKFEEEKKKEPCRVELHCLKNRGGVPVFSCFFDFFKSEDFFRESKRKS